jgi:hypothetical protein
LLHGDHWQFPPHDWVPPLPQAWIVLTEHTPSPAHADHADHIPVVLSQVRICVPHLPHACAAAPLHV